jgi:hypothetical protein
LFFLVFWCLNFLTDKKGVVDCKDLNALTQFQKLPKYPHFKQKIKLNKGIWMKCNELSELDAIQAANERES